MFERTIFILLQDYDVAYIYIYIIYYIYTCIRNTFFLDVPSCKWSTSISHSARIWPLRGQQISKLTCRICLLEGPGEDWMDDQLQCGWFHGEPKTICRGLLLFCSTAGKASMEETPDVVLLCLKVLALFENSAAIFRYRIQLSESFYCPFCRGRLIPLHMMQPRLQDDPLIAPCQCKGSIEWSRHVWSVARQHQLGKPLSERLDRRQVCASGVLTPLDSGAFEPFRSTPGLLLLQAWRRYARYAAKESERRQCRAVYSSFTFAIPFWAFKNGGIHILDLFENQTATITVG